VKERALAGVFIVAGRSVVILLVAFGGTVVLARLLTPHDFGVIAIGTAVVMVVALFSDGGLGAALIRRPEPPALRELEALMGIQLSATVPLTLAFAAVAIPLGETAGVVAVMTASMPIVALQFPGRIVLERELRYRPLAVVEVTQIVTYYCIAVALVLAGMGVWGLACATIAMRIASAIVMALVSPVGIVRPRFLWPEIRSLLGFGVQFQAVNATWIIRDLTLSAGIAAIAAPTTLGLWTLAKRLLEVPTLVYESLLRVSFPTMSRLVAAKQDTSRLIERAAGMAIIANGVILTGLAASAPGLVPGLFGERWQDACYAIPWSCLGLAISGSVVVATQSYFYAVGAASVPLRANALQAAVWVAVTLPLVPSLGVAAVGLGWLVSAIFEVIVLERALRRWTRVNLVRPLLGPMLLGIAASGLGWLVAVLGGANLISGIVAGLLASAIFLAGMLVLRRPLVVETYRLGLRSMRAGISRRADRAAA
jgi:O-antigen/teichoic acid export membrane protein